jgi:hypothetical protein
MTAYPKCTECGINSDYLHGLFFINGVTHIKEGEMLCKKCCETRGIVSDNTLPAAC